MHSSVLGLPAYLQALTLSSLFSVLCPAYTALLTLPRTPSFIPSTHDPPGFSSELQPENSLKLGQS